MSRKKPKKRLPHPEDGVVVPFGVWIRFPGSGADVEAIRQRGVSPASPHLRALCVLGGVIPERLNVEARFALLSTTTGEPTR